MNPTNTITIKIACLILIFLTCLFKYGENLGQANNISRYKTWVRINNSLINQPGYLYNVDAESIHFMSFYKDSSGKREIMRQEILYKDLDRFLVRKKGAVGVGVLLGALAGAAFGAIVGYATEPSDSFIGKDGAALVAAILFAPIGMGVGAGVGGSVKQRIPIEKNPEKYDVNELVLRDYVIEQQAIMERKK